MTTSKAIIIGAAILAFAILTSTRFATMGSGGAYFIVHDRWTGIIKRCHESDRPPGSYAVTGFRWYCEASDIVGWSPALWH